MIRSGWLVNGIEILAVVFPEANGTDEIVPALRERNEVTARAEMPWRRIRRLVPFETVRYLAEFIAWAFPLLTHVAFFAELLLRVRARSKPAN